ncbi:DNA adenine methylase [uncultured Campylobacter sp.]|uniref:DNA adenine methylase n=1 Tax=uncultured Campylobacter sp. TaxID=218934 RepID=UPI00261EC3FD|nr:DNA adenine methylase [uncultured Campylobacter sp.]
MTNYFKIENRRYIGAKTKLLDWIFDNLPLEDIGSVADIFAGSGVVAQKFIANSNANKIIINDFLYSNKVIYQAFFKGDKADFKELENIKQYCNEAIQTVANYFSDNFADTYFSYNDCLKIGSIREYISKANFSQNIENILLASLIYSMDKVANTVGHYDAYIKQKKPIDKFKFELIRPIKSEKTIEIYKRDANELSKNIKADLFFIDPPYNSRQYSRFYHIYENLVKWEKPKLSGVALKPKEENMSEYCKVSASKSFSDLIENLDCKYIAVTYNNTYASKSSSSKNKISYEQLKTILSKKGQLYVKERPYSYFNAGKTALLNHKEFLFFVDVK